MCSKLSSLLCGLVLVCSSAVVWRSSRSHQGSGASLLVDRLHSTFIRYKTSYPATQVVFDTLTYRCEDRATSNKIPYHLLPPSQKECCHEIRDDQTFLSLTSFPKNISSIHISLNKFILKNIFGDLPNGTTYAP